MPTVNAKLREYLKLNFEKSGSAIIHHIDYEPLPDHLYLFYNAKHAEKAIDDMTADDLDLPIRQVKAKVSSARKTKKICLIQCGELSDKKTINRISVITKKYYETRKDLDRVIRGTNLKKIPIWAHKHMKKSKRKEDEQLSSESEEEYASESDEEYVNESEEQSASESEEIESQVERSKAKKTNEKAKTGVLTQTSKGNQKRAKESSKEDKKKREQAIKKKDREKQKEKKKQKKSLENENKSENENDSEESGEEEFSSSQQK